MQGLTQKEIELLRQSDEVIVKLYRCKVERPEKVCTFCKHVFREGQLYAVTPGGKYHIYCLRKKPGLNEDLVINRGSKK